MGVSKIYPSLCCSRSVTPSTTEKVLTLCNVKEIHQYLFSLFHARDKRKEKTFFSVSSSSVKLTIILILFKNKPLSTSLILAVCRTRVIYELRNGPYPPKSLCGQARNPKVWGLISHVDPEFFFVLRLWQDENNIFLYFSIEPKTYHLSISDEDVPRSRHRRSIPLTEITFEIVGKLKMFCRLTGEVVSKFKEHIFA